MEKNFENNLLLDFYGNMLTEKQREVMNLYFNLDSSLSEIAGELNTTRQAVYDSVKVSKTMLENYEEKLSCVKKYLSNREVLLNTIRELEALKKDCENAEKVQNIIDNLQKVLHNQ